jgi:hypothetical protein
MTREQIERKLPGEKSVQRINDCDEGKRFMYLHYDGNAKVAQAISFQMEEVK